MMTFTIYVRRQGEVWQVAWDESRQWQDFPADQDSRTAKLLQACLAEALKLGQPFLARADEPLGVAFFLRGLRGRPD